VKEFEDVTNERGAMSLGQLLVLFISAHENPVLALEAIPLKLSDLCVLF